MDRICSLHVCHALWSALTFLPWPSITRLKRTAAIGFSSFRIDALVLGKLQDGTFDAAVSFETIEHLPNPEAFVASLRRILRPRGRLLISTPDRRLSSVLTILTRRPHNPHHLIEFTRPEFIALVSKGFDVSAVFGQSFVPSPLVACPVQSALKGIAHTLLGNAGRRFVERTYWRGNGTDVQPEEANKGKVANYVVLSCVARSLSSTQDVPRPQG
jgi:SAM-dependent methyltransferase